MNTQNRKLTRSLPVLLLFMTQTSPIVAQKTANWITFENREFLEITEEKYVLKTSIRYDTLGERHELDTLVNFDLQTMEQTITSTKVDVYLTSDTPPTFPGGQEAFKRFLADNLNYPKKAAAYYVDCETLVNFEVKPTGEYHMVSIRESSGNLLIDKEIFRVISMMPDWIPATNDGQPVSVVVTLPISF
jgi:TonB family protein